MGLLFGKKMEDEGRKAQAENFARTKAMIEAGPSLGGRYTAYRSSDTV